MDQLLKEIEQYFKLMSVPLWQSWRHGYFLSKNKELKEKEDLFLKLVPHYKLQIIQSVKETVNIREMTYLITLLGWADDMQLVSKHLFPLLKHKSHVVHNYVLRALFPVIVTRRIKINLKDILPLLSHKSDYCKNKVLGILATMKLTRDQRKELQAALIKIKKLAKRHQQMVYSPALNILKRQFKIAQ